MGAATGRRLAGADPVRLKVVKMIVVVGPIGAGKTSLIQAICYGVLLGSEATLSCCLYEFGALKIWDTPGDDKYSWQAETAVRRAPTGRYLSV